MNRRFRAGLLALPPLLLLVCTGALAQWVPTGELAKVPIVRDCNETAGDVAATRLDPPTIYLCPRVVSLVRKQYPGAEHFYLVHEFGHVAQDTADEALADCWAAKALADAPNGGRYLMAVIELLQKRQNERSPRYGAPTERAERIKICAQEERPDVFAALPARRHR